MSEPEVERMCDDLSPLDEDLITRFADYTREARNLLSDLRTEIDHSKNPVLWALVHDAWMSSESFTSRMYKIVERKNNEHR